MDSLKKEIYRKTSHMFLSLIAVFGGLYIYNNYGMDTLKLILLILTIVSLLIDFLRIDLKIKLPLYTSTLRKKEKLGIHGLTYGFIAAIIVVHYFSFNIALAAISMALFGDAVAAIIGRKYGKHRIYNNNSYEGALAGLILNIIIGFLILNNSIVIVSMALIASLTELVTDKIDDNLAVPLISGLVGHLIIYLI